MKYLVPTVVSIAVFFIAGYVGATIGEQLIVYIVTWDSVYRESREVL